jgi:surface carbohydrate biosynthesis protein
MRSIKFFQIKKADILILDVIAANFRNFYLPSGYNNFVLDFRKSIPVFLSIRFLKGLLVGFWQFLFSSERYFSLILLQGAVYHLRPRIIVTFSDNNTSLATYSRNNPNINMVMIQNACRSINSFERRIELPIFCALGDTEKNIFQELNIKTDTYHALGSVKLAIAWEQWQGQNKNTRDISFISHYRPNLFLAQSSSSSSKKIESCQRELFQLCCAFAKSRKLNLTVIAKMRGPSSEVDAERRYYENLADGCPLQFITSPMGDKELNSYFAGFESRLVVTPGSTLGFELLSSGTKVLFGATAVVGFVNSWGAKHYFERLPPPVCLSSKFAYNDFFKSCDDLLGMPQENFRAITQEPSNSIIAFSEKNPAHKMLAELISDNIR